MSDFKVIDGSLGHNQPIDETWATVEADGSTISPQVRPGLIVTAIDQATTDYGVGEFVYLKGVASTAVGDAVVYQYGDYQTTRTVAASVGLVGIAMSANLANQWGWYQIRGIAAVEVSAGFAADTICYLTANAGELDDTVVVGSEIRGTFGYTAIATPIAGQALISIQYPEVANV